MHHHRKLRQDMNAWQHRGLSVWETADQKEEGISAGGNATCMMLCPWALSCRAWPPRNNACPWRKLFSQVGEWFGRSWVGFPFLMGHQEILSPSMKWQQLRWCGQERAQITKPPGSWQTVCLQQVSPVPVFPKKPTAMSLSPTQSCLADCPSQGDKTRINHLWFGSAYHLWADTLTTQDWTPAICHCVIATVDTKPVAVNKISKNKSHLILFFIYSCSTMTCHRLIIVVPPAGVFRPILLVSFFCDTDLYQIS